MPIPPNLTAEDCYTGAQVRKKLGITRFALHKRRKNGSIAFIQFAPQIMYPRSAIDAMIAKANKEAHFPKP